jgi:hypothetical protein
MIGAMASGVVPAAASRGTKGRRGLIYEWAQRLNFWHQMRSLCHPGAGEGQHYTSSYTFTAQAAATDGCCAVWR